MRREGRRGTAAFLMLLLIVSVVIDWFVLLTGIGHAPAPAPVYDLFGWHFNLALVVMIALAWQWRVRSMQLFALVFALAPILAFGVLFLL
jgi:hypothetical protein